MHRKFAFCKFCCFCFAVQVLTALVLFALVPCSAAAQAQPHLRLRDGTVKINTWTTGATLLSHGWRFHRGDNPAYARLDFNDSSWQTVTVNDSWQTVTVKVPRGSQPGVSWYRLKVEIPSDHDPLALNVIGLKGAYQIYVNGVLVPGARLLPVLQDRYAAQTVLLPATGNAFVLAIRCVNPRMNAFGTPLRQVQLGTLDFMKRLAGAITGAYILERDASMPIEVACIFVGIAVLGLFYFQRQHKEYMWLGLYLITMGSSASAFFGSFSALLPLAANSLYGDPAVYLITLFQIEFTFAFVRQRVSRPWRAYEIVLLLSTLTAPVTNMLGLLGGAYLTYELFATVPATLVLPVLLWFWYRKGNREAGLLVIPSIFPGLASIFENTSFVANNVFHWSGADFLSRAIRLGSLGFQPVDLYNFVFLLAIGAVIFLRFTEVSRAEARTAAEMDAAREIQQTLVPAEPPAVEGYRLAAAYLPAEEVGGDFYQVLPHGDGGTIVALGDVSGKGLKAAMTGTLAIGVLRTLAATGLGPAALLAALNQQIVAGGQGGFITMLCAQVATDGAVTLANAGHLHPYRSGEEIELEPGLPLGIVSGVSYAERQIRLEPGERLTLISDGIVEARRKDGELFGFDRTLAGISATAQQMAEVAQEFGQEDDITVLPLTREMVAPAPVKLPAMPAAASPSPA